MYPIRNFLARSSGIVPGVCRVPGAPRAGLGRVASAGTMATPRAAVAAPRAALRTSSVAALPRNKNSVMRSRPDEHHECSEQEEEQGYQPKVRSEGGEPPGDGKNGGRSPERNGNGNGEGSSAGGSSGGSSGNGSDGGEGSGSGDDGGSPMVVMRNTVPAVYPQVLALPITRRPLFPGFYKAVVVKNPQVCAAIKEALKRGQPYIGAFLLKDEEEDADVITNLDRVHRVGVFAQVTSIFPAQTGSRKEGEERDDEEGITAVLYPHRRIHIDELVLPHAAHNAPQAPSPAPASGDEGAVQSEAQGESEEQKRGLSPTLQTSFLHNYDVSLVNVSNLSMEPYDKKHNQYIRAVMSELITVFKDIANLNPLFRDQVANFSISQGAGNVFEEPEKLADFAAAVSSSEVSELQGVLQSMNVEDRLQKALLVLKKELMNAQLQSKISKDVENKIQKRQREYYLMEQLKGIKKELGMESDGKDKMVEKFRGKAAELRMPDGVRKVFDEELSKLQTLEPAASEFNVTRGYLEWLTSIPWGVFSPENFSIQHAMQVLDEDHFGLKDVKDRILEFLAIGKLRGTVEGKIICLVGPPGVGKTSIGKSIARALERQFFRFSVGGLSDVAEIKGHRRTYVGAMPGKAIQALKKVGTENPLVLIDEVDKIGRGYNGDPSSALLEMLDPEQNSSFLDHYMDVPVDLSRVLFVCTANTLETIPQPLLDRMEVIEVSSYTAEEKRFIGRDYLAPQAKEASGLADAKVHLPESAIDYLIRHYARESGVRGLRKLLEKVYRKVAFDIVKQHGESVFPEPDEAPAKEGAEAAPASEAPASPAQDVPGGPLSDTQSVVSPAIGESSTPSSPAPSDGSTAVEGSDSETPKVTTQLRKPMRVPSTVDVTLTEDKLREYLGPPIYHKDRLYTKTMPPGVSTGLGYLGNGSGSLMPVETTFMPGKGHLQLTGKLGDVIKESAALALSWMKANAYDLGLTKDASTNLLETQDVHLHMPEGAIGKEGPSAGVAFVASLVSLATNRQLSTTLAMTGEVSLRGMVLPVGGLKEKLLAAHRAGITDVILPAQNKPSVEADVPETVLHDLNVHYVTNVWSALEIAFGDGPWTERAREWGANESPEDHSPI